VSPVPCHLPALSFEGMTIKELVETYDGLTREHVEAVLEFAARSLETPAPAR
jgi:uncharacterized protein (DUF433 family)